MKLKRMNICTLALASVLLLSHSTITTVEAKEKGQQEVQEQREVKENSPTKSERSLFSRNSRTSGDVGNILQYEKYQNIIYSFATPENVVNGADPISGANAGASGAPSVGLYDVYGGENGKNVYSIYKNGSGLTTAAINFYLGDVNTIDKLAGDTKSYPVEYTGQKIVDVVAQDEGKLGSNSSGKVLTGTIEAGNGWSKYGYKALPFENSTGTAKMYASQDVVMQEFTYKNTSTTESVLVTPVKQVDTMLGNQDDDPEADNVPIYSRGKNKGMYMEDRKGKYRLDYMTDIVGGPAYYGASEYYDSVLDVFGTKVDPSNPKEKKSLANPKGQENEVENTILLEDADTGMFMMWPTKEIGPLETYTIRYGVGLKLGADFAVEKTSKNKTQNSGKNYVGDEIEFEVDISTKDQVKAVMITDLLPEGFSDPENIVYTNEKGQQKAINSADVFDPVTREINLEEIELMDAGASKLTYTTKIGRKLDGLKVETNVIARSWHVMDQKNAQKFYTLSVEPIPSHNLTVKYSDEKGQAIIPDIVKAYKEGAEYEAPKQVIDGFTLDRVEGVEKELMGTKPVEVVYHYTTNQFSLAQSVKDKDGNVATGVSPGSDLFYTVDLASGLTKQATPSYYDGFTFTVPLDSNIAGVSEMKLINSRTLAEVGTVKHDALNRQILATITAANAVESSDSLSLSYKATVSTTAPAKSIIAGNASAEGNYTAYGTVPAIIARKQVAPTVETIVSDSAQLKVLFVDEAGKEVHKAVNRDVKISNVPIDLAKDVEVSDIVKGLKVNYDLPTLPVNEVITIVAGINTVEYEFKGALKMISAPKGFEFGTKAVPLQHTVYRDPKIVGDSLVISDTRPTKEKWRLIAKLDKLLTSVEDSNYFRPNAIQYQNDNVVKVLSKDEVEIFDHLHTDSSEYDVGKENWSKGDGFQIALGRGAIQKMGAYEAQMTITLENAK